MYMSNQHLHCNEMTILEEYFVIIHEVLREVLYVETLRCPIFGRANFSLNVQHEILKST